MDTIDGLLGRTGPVTFALNHQVIYPEVGFTCNGTIERVVFGAGDIYGQRTGRPLLQIWRPVGDTTFMLVSQRHFEYLLLFEDCMSTPYLLLSCSKLETSLDSTSHRRWCLSSE